MALTLGLALTGAQLLLGLALLPSCSPAEAVQLSVAPAVQLPGAAPAARHSLAGQWRLFLDPGAVGEDDGWVESLTSGEVPESAPGDELFIAVPGPLESLPNTASYDGVAWLASEFSLPGDSVAARQLLSFGQANYQVRVWIDGEFAGEHEGGYDAFRFDVTEWVRPGESQTLVVRLLDPGATATGGLSLATTPHAKESWYHNFGGLIGPVELLTIDEPCPELTALHVDVDSGVVRATVDLLAAPGRHKERVVVGLTVYAIPLRERWDGNVDGLTAVARGQLRSQLHSAGLSVEVLAEVSDPQLWSPASPQRYAAVISVNGAQVDHPGARRTFGFRTVSLDQDGLRLNGRLTKLFGVLYQPHWAGLNGATPPAEYLEATVSVMLDTGFNLVRAHVRPAPVAFLDAADRQGLLVLEEPAIGWVADDPGLGERLDHEVDWMVARDHHHPSIIMWGMLNELSGKAYRYGEELSLRVAAADKTRPVLEDSGGFFGGRYVPSGGDQLLPMRDEHFYPPFPLPPAERHEMATVSHESGPTFVSEFGYGTLVDTRSAASGFFDRQLRGDERNLFGGLRGAARRARERGEDWLEAWDEEPIVGARPSDARALTNDPGDWVDESAEIQAQAARAMLEALRIEEGLDLLCYTQWRAVSSESSAGLLTPWGKERPVREVIKDALRPLMIVAIPERPSVVVGETLTFELFVVNDTGAPVWASLHVDVTGAVPSVGAADVRVLRQVYPAGVTRVRRDDLVVHCDQSGAVSLQAELLSDDEVVERSRRVQVTAVEAPPVRQVLTDLAAGPDGATEEELTVALHLPEGREDLANFAGRQGFTVTNDLRTDDPWDVVSVIADPSSLLGQVPLQERLELWQRVWSGGAAIVLLRDPIEDAFGSLVAGHRGSRRMAAVPLPVSVAAAAGNFRGRVHPVFEALAVDGDGRGTMAFGPARTGPPGLAPRQVVHADRPDPVNLPRVRLLTEHDGLLSPEALLAGALPKGTRPAMITLDHSGQRIGTPVAAVPFGRGTITLVGLPLLDKVQGQADPLRDETLAHLVLESAAEVADRFRHGATGKTPFKMRELEPLLDAEVVLYSAAFERVAQAIELADRYSTIGGTADLPPTLAKALKHQIDAIKALVSGHRVEARESLTLAHEMAWTAELQAFLALDAIVIDMVEGLLTNGTFADRDLAYETLELWRSGVASWFAGDVDLAYAWLGRAELLVNTSGRLATPP
ncbi:MAG: hypothetical protein ACI9EF_002118 [Pseudohongiellaceae bacterium]|jgi:hypothetical protein